MSGSGSTRIENTPPEAGTLEGNKRRVDHVKTDPPFLPAERAYLSRFASVGVLLSFNSFASSESRVGEFKSSVAKLQDDAVPLPAGSLGSDVLVAAAMGGG